MPPDQPNQKPPGKVIQAPTRNTPSAKTKENLQTRKLIRYTIAILIGLGILIIIYDFIAQPFVVNGISMQPTFHTGNVVLVWKFPQTWAKLTGGEYIPKRGNVVVIGPYNIEQEQLIKRVIALPGERVDISNNNLVIYNQSNPMGLNLDNTAFDKALMPPVGNFMTQVGLGQIFVLGDNRSPGGSIDSRSSLGNIPSNIIVGQVVLKIFPFTEITAY